MLGRTPGRSDPKGTGPRPTPSSVRRTSAPRFNRIPFRVVLLALFLGLSGFFAAVACETPWFSESGTIPTRPFSSTFTVDFTPGLDGYVISCAIVVTESNCLTTAYAYSTGNGTGLLTGLYLALLGTMTALAILVFVGVGVVLAGFLGRLRVRRAHRLVITVLLVGIVASAAAIVAQPTLQGPALQEEHACAGFSGSVSPCSSLSGRASGVACQNNSCGETNVAWAPGAGWYFAMVSVGFAMAALVTLRYRPLGAPCPSCGVENSFQREFCLACGVRLPALPQKPYRALEH